MRKFECRTLVVCNDYCNDYCQHQKPRFYWSLLVIANNMQRLLSAPKATFLLVVRLEWTSEHIIANAKKEERENNGQAHEKTNICF